MNIAQAINQSPLNRGLDGETWLSTPGNVAILLPVKDDITLFDYEGDGIYEVHFLFQSRGKEALRSAREAITRIFDEHGASMIFGMAPECRPDVRLFARWLGMKSRGLRYTVHGFCELFILPKYRWKGSHS